MVARDHLPGQILVQLTLPFISLLRADWRPLGNPAYTCNLPIMTIFTHDSWPVETGKGIMEAQFTDVRFTWFYVYSHTLR